MGGLLAVNQSHSPEWAASSGGKTVRVCLSMWWLDVLSVPIRAAGVWRTGESSRGRGRHRGAVARYGAGFRRLGYGARGEVGPCVGGELGRIWRHAHAPRLHSEGQA